MKFNPRKHRKYVIAGGLLLATATPSFALFGLGDIVFDPTNYASLISQGATALNQLRTIENNVTHFSFKQQWQTTLNALKTKIFLAILAALTVIGGAVLYQRDQMHKAASSGKNSRDSPMQRDDAEYQKQKTKSFGRRSKRTRSGTVLQRHMKARPRKRTSPKPTEKKPPSWLPLRC